MEKELRDIKWKLLDLFKYCDELEDKSYNELAKSLEYDIDKLISQINKLQEKGE